MRPSSFFPGEITAPFLITSGKLNAQARKKGLGGEQKQSFSLPRSASSCPKERTAIFVSSIHLVNAVVTSLFNTKDANLFRNTPLALLIPLNGLCTGQ